MYCIAISGFSLVIRHDQNFGEHFFSSEIYTSKYKGNKHWDVEIWRNFFRAECSSMHTSHPWHGSRRIYVAIQEQCLHETTLEADRFKRHAKAAPTSFGI